MRIIRVKGTYYEAGVAIGQEARNELRDFIKAFETDYPGLETLLPQAVYDKFLETTKFHCPEYLSEMQGMADGAEVTFRQIFLINIEPEMTSYLEMVPPASHDVKYRQSSGCTTICRKMSDGKEFLAHTEDVHPAAANTGFILEAEITQDGNPDVCLERFIAYMTPGFLPGSSHGFNMYGLAHAHNNIFQKGANLNGIPRHFVVRKALRAKNLEEAGSILREVPGAGAAFSLILAKSRDKNGNGPEMAVFESAGDSSQIRVHRQKPSAFYHHCNTFQHILLPCHPEESTIHRKALLSQFCYKQSPNSRRELLELMSNQDDPVFPIYRTGTSPDHLATGSTGVFNLTDAKADIFYGKPSENEPVKTYDL